MQVQGKNTLLAAAAVLLCVTVALFFWLRSPSKPSGSGQTAAAADPPRAVVATVARGPMASSLSTAGEFVAYQQVDLHAKVAGYIRHINVDIGDHVRQGQVLAVLEVPELNAQVAGAGAGVRHSHEEITRAQNEVKRAEADHAALHAASDRLQQAAKARPGLIALQELDDSAARDRAAEAQVEVAKSALAAAQQQFAVSEAGMSQVSAMQDYSRIVAPFAGVITWRYADTGALVQAGTSNTNALPVVKLAQVSVLRLRIPVPESLADRVRVGTTADVRVQATGAEFTGKVARLTDAYDRSTRTMQAEVDVPNPANKLAPGMYADVKLQISADPAALTIPQTAIQRDNGKVTVLVVDPTGHVRARDVQLGLEGPDRVEIKDGLREGERVIAANLGAYQPGELVTPQQSRMAQAARSGGDQ